MANVVVLISGSGSNLQALIDAGIPIKHVISSSADAYGLQRAAKADIETSVHALKQYYKGIPKEDKEARTTARNKFDDDLALKIIDLKADMVVCAGWMLILSPHCLKPLAKADVKIINLHPALPGMFAGTHAIERSFEAGQKGEVEKGGCMIHYVIEEVDMGKTILVSEIDVIKGETVEKWEERIHAAEHKAIVKGTQIVLEEINKNKAESAPHESENEVEKATEELKKLSV